MVKLISNAAGAYGQVGIENNARIVHERLTSSDVAVGDVVVFDAVTGTGEDADLITTVHAAGGGDATAAVSGVATENAASGEVVKVVEFGPAVMNLASAANVTDTTWRSALSADGIPNAGQSVVFVRG